MSIHIFMRSFSSYVERQDRQNKDNLRTLGYILSKAGFKVHDHLNHHGDPFLYIEKPTEHDRMIETLEFGGIRLYNRGSDLVCYRTQNRETTEPYGAAYLLDVKGMYKNLLQEKEERVAQNLVRYLVEEVLNFFMQSAIAKNKDDNEIEDDTLGKIVGARDSNIDYANQVTGDTRRNTTN